MKILGILGSPHSKGNTVLLLDAVLEAAAAAGAEVEKVELGGKDLQFCVGCSRCYSEGSCRYNDDAETIKSSMLAAEGIVLASPNYMNSVTAQLKTLMDRCSAYVHCFMLQGKYGASVATAGGSGEEEVAEFGNAFLRHCGAQTVGHLGVKAAGVSALAQQDTALAAARQLGTDLVTAIKERWEYPEQAAAHVEFSLRMKDLVTRMAEKAPFQYEYWEKMGWL